jgi:hypothetical protein
VSKSAEGKGGDGGIHTATRDEVTRRHGDKGTRRHGDKGMESEGTFECGGIDTALVLAV